LATRKILVAGVVLGVPLSALFLYLATRGLDPTEVSQALRGADPSQIVLAVAVIALVYSLQAARWKRIARPLGAARWRTTLRYIVSGVAVNNVVPGRPGDLMRGYWLARALRVPSAKAYGTLIVDRSSDVFVLIALLVVTYPFIPHPAWLHRIILLAVAAGAMIALWLLVTRWHTGGGRSVRGIPQRARTSWIGNQISGLVHGTAAAVNCRTAIVVGAMSAVVWILWALSAWLVAGSLGIALSPVQALFVTAVINLGAALPSSPGFIGTFQYLSVAALGLFGVAHSAAFAFSILMTAVWYVPTTIAGAGIAVWGGRRFYHTRRHRQASSPPAKIPSRLTVE
jgi:uncharacterized protein (TIRG00374 family)